MINDDNIEKIFKIINIVGAIFIVFFFLYVYQAGVLDSRASLEQFMSDLGILAPLIFFLIQLVQTILPFIPATLTIPMGTILFGDILGFFLNYFSIVLGSAINFYIARHYGQGVVEKLVGEKNFQRGREWLSQGNHFNRLFILSAVQPISPGDLMCYIAGLSKMSWRFFITWILIGKVTTLLIYLIGTKTIVEFIFSLF